MPEDGSITLARPAVAPGEKTRYGIFYTTPEGTRKLFSKTVRGDFEHTLDGPCTVEELRPLTLGVTGVVR